MCSPLIFNTVHTLLFVFHESLSYWSACLLPPAVNLKRSTPQRWQSLSTSQMTPTQRNRCCAWSISSWRCCLLISPPPPSTSFSPSTSCSRRSARGWRACQWWVAGSHLFAFSSNDQSYLELTNALGGLFGKRCNGQLEQPSFTHLET